MAHPFYLLRDIESICLSCRDMDGVVRQRRRVVEEKMLWGKGRSVDSCPIPSGLELPLGVDYGVDKRGKVKGVGAVMKC